MPWDATKPSPNACQKLPNLGIVERFALAVPRPRGKPRGTRHARATFFREATQCFVIAPSFEKRGFVMTLGVRL